MPTSYLSRAQESHSFQTGAKVMVFGGSLSGKSHDGYENLPRPLLVVDADTSADAFTDEARFDAFRRLGLQHVPTADALLEFLEEFVSAPEEGSAKYRGLMIDSLTFYLDQKKRELKIDMSREAQQAARDHQPGQADYARYARRFNELIRRVSDHGVVVYVVDEARTVFEGKNIVTTDERKRSSMGESKFTHPFDIILQKVSRERVIVHKSRYGKWQKGQKIETYRAARDLKPILDGREKKRRGLEDFDPATKAHDELMDLIRTLGSKSRGGVIEREDMERFFGAAQNNALSASDVREIINEIKRKFGDPTASPTSQVA